MKNFNLQSKPTNTSHSDNRKKIIRKKLKSLFNIILILVSFGILVYFCVVDNNLFNLINLFPSLNSLFIILAASLLIISWYFDSLVLYKIINSTPNTKRQKKFVVFGISVIGQYFTLLTPLGVGGQPIQVLELTKRHIDKSTALSIVTKKFFIYQTTFLIYLFISIIFSFQKVKNLPKEYIAALIIGIIFQGSIIFALFLFSTNKRFTLKIVEFFLHLLNKIRIIKDYKKILNGIDSKLDFFVKINSTITKNKLLNVKLSFYTFMQLSAILLIPFFVFQAFGEVKAQIPESIFSQMLTNTISSFTPLPGSAGTAEKSFLIMFRDYLTPQKLASAMLICRAITFYLAIIFGTVFYKIYGKLQK